METRPRRRREDGQLDTSHSSELIRSAQSYGSRPNSGAREKHGLDVPLSPPLCFHPTAPARESVGPAAETVAPGGRSTPVWWESRSPPPTSVIFGLVDRGGGTSN